jgi:hypothetical protein
MPVGPGSQAAAPAEVVEALGAPEAGAAVIAGLAPEVTSAATAAVPMRASRRVVVLRIVVDTFRERAPVGSAL